MDDVPSFEEYLSTLGRLSVHLDVLAPTDESRDIKFAVMTLGMFPVVDVAALTVWAAEYPKYVNVLGLVVGLGQERLKNVLRHRFDTTSWAKVARERPGELIEWFDTTFDLVQMLNMQRFKEYEFADVLVARAGSRATAKEAGKAGRGVEDQIEAIAAELGLRYETRTRFTGRDNKTAPCDLVVPSSADAHIVVAAKGFDSTGSKLGDTVREIEEMAAIRRPTQFVMAVIDGIGWKSRQSDLRKIHSLWVTGDIDGMYTLATLDRFKADLKNAAVLRGLIHYQPPRG